MTRRARRPDPLERFWGLLKQWGWFALQFKVLTTDLRDELARLEREAPSELAKALESQAVRDLLEQAKRSPAYEREAPTTAEKDEPEFPGAEGALFRRLQRKQRGDL